MEKQLLDRSQEEYQTLQAGHTAREIQQQPQLWQDIQRIITQEIPAIETFLQKQRTEQTKIIFTGAGTSEFVGNTVVPYLQSRGCRNFSSISSTDLVSSPESYLSPEDEVLLVSCARSGSSPESVAAARLVDAYARRTAHLILCCNPQGELARQYQGQSNAFVLILKGACDLGFAMTGSFSSMVLAAAIIFDGPGTAKQTEQARTYAPAAQTLINTLAADIQDICRQGKQRIICLGSAQMKGIAQEAHLKILELSAGKHTAHFDSPLGFRHGPKSLLNDQSLVLFFMSDSPYTRRYEYDLLQEMCSNAGEHYIVAISPAPLPPNVPCDKLLLIPSAPPGASYFHALSAVLVAQLIALENSIRLGITPDNPSPSGLVNRVVQGVTIYPHSGPPASTP
ncbi:MAG: SIS domain-containing protein [Spirochaetota bacterium]